jgi:hypothetical protein
MPSGSGGMSANIRYMVRDTQNQTKDNSTRPIFAIAFTNLPRWEVRASTAGWLPSGWKLAGLRLPHAERSTSRLALLHILHG